MKIMHLERAYGSSDRDPMRISYHLICGFWLETGLEKPPDLFERRWRSLDILGLRKVIADAGIEIKDTTWEADKS